MGTIYCGPFSAAINEGTRYGHEGYAVQVLHDGTESPHWVRSFREYRAGCDCGWRSARVHPPTDAGEDAALEQFGPTELRRMVVTAAATRPDGKLTEREHGRCDVIETVESRLEDIAVAMPDETTPRPTSGAW